MRSIALAAIFYPLLLAIMLSSFANSQPETPKAQKPNPLPPAPVPAQILEAKRVFIANAGQDGITSRASIWKFSGGPNRSYDQFYASMKEWGHYELVDSPAKCDLVFQIRSNLSGSGGPYQIRIEVLDPKTHIALWGFTEFVEGAALWRNRDKNFDEAMTRIMDDVKGLISPAVAENSRQ